MPEHPTPPAAGEAMTVAALKADHWNVIRLNLPEHPDRALVEAGWKAAVTCKDEIKPELEEVGVPDERTAGLESVYREIWRRLEFFDAELAKLPPRRWPTLDELHELAQEAGDFVLGQVERWRSPGEPDVDR